MISILWDQKFKRAYKRKVRDNKELKEKFWASMGLFSKNPFDPRLRTHRLTGRLEGLWALSVSHDCRLIFSFMSHQEILLVDIGSHDEVY